MADQQPIALRIDNNGLALIIFTNFTVFVDSFMTTWFVLKNKTSNVRLKICLLSLYIHSEGTLSQIFNLGLNLYFMSKNV